MKSALFHFLFVFFVISCGLSSARRRPLFRAARDADKTGQYIVVLNSDTSDEEYERTLGNAVRLSDDKRAYCTTKTVEKSFTLKLNPFTLERIRHYKNVNHIEEEQYAFGSQDPLVPWHLDRIDQKDILRDYQYSPQNTGEGVDVYILDTGINYDHEQFERRAKYSGYDSVDVSPYYDDEPKQMGRDCQGHGTHVSSLIGGKTFGTAQRVNLYSVRVLDCRNFAPWSVVLNGMDYVARVKKESKRPMVVVMSLGGSYQPATNEAVQNLHNMGVVVVVAAGNGRVDACTTSPASSEYAISVAGSNGTDNLYWYGPGTNYGKCVDIFAPGDSILGADYSCFNCTRHLSGTSMATPMVAGIAAMYLQKEPLLSPDEVKEKLRSEAIKDKLDFSLFPEEGKKDTPNLLLQTQGGCGGVYMYRTQFNITSPGYPNPYPPSQLCEWKIIADKDQDITLTILDIELESQYDYLLVCDGQTCQYDNIKAKYTGNMSDIAEDPSAPDLTVRSSANYLTVLLRTDSNDGGRGFLAMFTKYYQGTPLIVKDLGKYLPSQTRKPIPGAAPLGQIKDVLGVRVEDSMELISNYNSLGYSMYWIDSWLNRTTKQWYYDFLFQNSSVEVSKGYVEVNSTRIQQLVELEKENELVAETITARSIGEGGFLYGIVFKKRSHLIESHVVTGEDQYPSVVTRQKLREAGWTMVCHHVLSTDGNRLKISAVFHRDKRRRYGIQIGEQEKVGTLAYYGFDFYHFTSVTLTLGVQNYYPRYVSSYNLEEEVDSRLSVIYEERLPDTTYYNWYRWGLNVTEVQRDVKFFRDSWSPFLLCGYIYRKEIAYMMVWERHIS